MFFKLSKYLIGLFFLTESSLFTVSSSQTLDNNVIHNLKTELFSNYTYDTIPTDEEPLNLSMGIAIRAFSNIDQKEGTVELNVWLRYNWFDTQLKWDSNRWNISSLVLPTDIDFKHHVWTPDIYLYNTAETPLENLKFSNVLVTSDGNVLWSRPGMIKATCRFDLTHFPYDQQNCYLKLGSWSYTGYHLIIQKYNPTIDLDNYQLNEEWHLKSTSADVNKLKYNCCPDDYYDITFNFTLKRHSGYYETNIIIPTFATASLILITLLIPWESGERISFTVTVMLSLIVFLLLLSDILPKSNQNPLLSRMITGLTFFSLLGVFFTVLISALNEYNKTVLKKKEEITNPFINFLFKSCKYITCSQDNCIKGQKHSDHQDNTDDKKSEIYKSDNSALTIESGGDPKNPRDSFDTAIDSLNNHSVNMIIQDKETQSEKLNLSDSDLLRSKSYNEATLRKRTADNNLTANKVNEINEANKNENDRKSNIKKKDDEEELTPLQQECKTFITVVERLYSIVFLIGFVSLCLVMILSRYNSE